jgi:hypothetical protein
MNVNFNNIVQSNQYNNSAVQLKKSTISKSKLYLNLDVNAKMEAVRAKGFNPDSKTLKGIISSKLGKKNYVSVQLDKSSPPVYVKVSDLSSILGISKELIRAEAKKHKGDVTELVRSEQQLAKQIDPKLLVKIKSISIQMGSFEYAKSIATMGTKIKFKDFNFTAKHLVEGNNFQSEKARNTIVVIGQQLANQSDLSSSTAIRFESPPKTQSYGFTLHEGDVYISQDDKSLGSGGYKQVSEAIQLSTLETYAEATVAEHGIEVAQAGAEKLKELHSLGIPHLVPMYKFSINIQSPDQKAVFMQQKLDGDGMKLAHEVPFHQCISVLRDVAAGLGEMHKHGYVHGDVKLANMLFKKVESANSQQYKGYIHDFDTLMGPKISSNDSFTGGTGFYLPPEAVIPYFHEESGTTMLIGNPDLDKKFVNGKIDSFSLGMALLTLINPNLYSELGPKGFSSYNQTAMDSYLQKVSDEILKSGTKEEQALKHEVLNIIKDLLKIDPDNRLSCKIAGDRLDALATAQQILLANSF